MHLSALRRFSDFARSVRHERDVFGAILAASIVFYGLGALWLAGGGEASRFFVERFHLQSESFTRWALFAPSPWMYNFENRYLVSPDRLSTAQLDEAAPERVWRYVNHHPGQIATFAERRIGLLKRAPTVYIYLDSRYRDIRVRSELRVRSEDGTSGVPRRVHLDRPSASR